jgi:hypothetical protein
MRQTKILPDGYTTSGTLDLAHNPRLQLILTAASLICFVVFGYLFIIFAVQARPEWHSGFIVRFDILAVFVWLIGFVIISSVVAVVHELVHGAFYWIFTHEQPVFGFRSLYAFAGAPAWYFPRGPFLVVGLAPLVVLTALGLALVPVIPFFAVPALLLAMTLNAGGAIGDIAAVIWILLQPRKILIRDTGDVMTIYRPQ